MELGVDEGTLETSWDVWLLLLLLLLLSPRLSSASLACLPASASPSSSKSSTIIDGKKVLLFNVISKTSYPETLIWLSVYNFYSLNLFERDDNAEC